MNNTQRAHRREEYIARINRVIDYIDSHLDRELNLRILARVANFSPYHFHRIFRGVTGEALNQFIRRVRLEKAAAQLRSDTKKSITAIALDCGFSGSSTFARLFRDYFGISASQWRSRRPGDTSKIGKAESKDGKTESKKGKDSKSSSAYIEVTTKKKIRRTKMQNKQKLDVQVRQIPDMPVAYVRHIGPYKGDAALFDTLFSRLFRWAGPRDLLRFPETKVMAVYHDDPAITDESRLRTSVCITVPKGTKGEGEVGIMTVPKGKYACARFELKDDEYQAAWDALFGSWLPGSGYQPDDRPCFELYCNDPKEHPEGKCIVDICIPVKPL